jgi:hypothetical protein
VKGKPTPWQKRKTPPETAQEVIARLDPTEIGASVVREGIEKAALTVEHIVASLSVADAPRARAIIAKANTALDGDWVERETATANDDRPAQPKVALADATPPEVIALLASRLAPATMFLCDLASGKLHCLE